MSKRCLASGRRSAPLRLLYKHTGNDDIIIIDDYQCVTITDCQFNANLLFCIVYYVFYVLFVSYFFLFYSAIVPSTTNEVDESQKCAIEYN